MYHPKVSGTPTVLYESHRAAGAKMVDFGGWDMPLNYGSQLDEHRSVRQAAGLFDVSHMTIVDVTGPGSESFLSRALANDIATLERPGAAIYSCMLNERGGVVDDLIAYRLAPDCYRLVVNAATRATDLAWLEEIILSFDARLAERADLAMLAVQGPAARSLACGFMPESDRLMALKPFTAASVGEYFVSRTGYTGEDGWEIMLPAELAIELWERLIGAGVCPCGLGARDTLRLEAGLNLYGSDMDATTTPLESNLAWTVAMEPKAREFIGRFALERQLETGVARRLVGLVLTERGVLRDHQRVVVGGGDAEGEITSGGYSPTLERSIALARVPANVSGTVHVDIRGTLKTASVAGPPFVRNGRALVQLNEQMQPRA